MHHTDAKSKFAIYEKCSIEYRNYLIDQINKEINKLNAEELLNDLYLVLEPSQFSIEKDLSVFKKKLSNYLRNQYGTIYVTERLDRILASIPSLHRALIKYKVIIEALGLLHNTEQHQDAIDKFINHLVLNKLIIATPRLDYGLYAFVKGLGVTVATILGAGIGGYFAYDQLFVKTRGKEYLEKIADTENFNSLRP